MHPVLVEAACDKSLPTAELVCFATDFVREERKGLPDNEPLLEEQAPAWIRNGEVNFPLLILQQRVCRATIQVAFGLLFSLDSAERQLGAEILRELPSLNSAPHKHSLEAIHRLEESAKVEKDGAVLAWILSAIGWQCHPKGTEVLLAFIGHESDSIRLMVANNILMGSKETGEISQSTLAGVLTLIEDGCPEIQWSILYEVADRPQLFASNPTVMKQAAQLVLVGAPDGIKEQALRVISVLKE